MWKRIEKRILQEIPPMTLYTTIQMINILNCDKHWLFKVGFARIYPAIHKLEKQGWIDCTEDKRYYWVRAINKHDISD